MNLCRFAALAVTSACLTLTLTCRSVYASVLYQFNGVANGGTASATMLIDIAGNTLTAKINNTSPNPNPNPGNLADPAITGFGFQFTTPGLTMTSWCLNASSTNVGGTCAGSTNKWLFETGAIAGVDVDFGAQTDKGVKGALYAAGADDLGGPPHFYGEAIFILVFNIAPTLEELFGPCNGQGVGCSPFIRFQNVGANGGGSLKLPGVPTTEVPEPGTLALMGLLLAALSFIRRGPTLRLARRRA